MSDFQFEDVARAAHAHRRDEQTDTDKTKDAGPAGGPAAKIQSLQRAAGNAAVGHLLQREEGAGAGAASVKDIVGKGGGSPLPEDVRGEMESGLGADLSGVRVHTDSKADESAKAVNAHAYTSGSDVVFQQGKYDPSSTDGKKTLAHELTHVVQQSQGPVDGTSVGGGIKVSDPHDRFEQEADQVADDVVSRQSAQPDVQREAAPEEEEPVAGQWVQREAAPEEEEPVAGQWVQREAAPEEEEPVAGQWVQRQEDEGEMAEGEE
ncbi:MAG: DUF4157 domain-containing protein [Actinobacteria bacterium]|nr:DUF4157 domain-containing protein [Actinomycetota bacterium]